MALALTSALAAPCLNDTEHIILLNCTIVLEYSKVKCGRFVFDIPQDRNVYLMLFSILTFLFVGGGLGGWWSLVYSNRRVDTLELRQ